MCFDFPIFAEDFSNGSFSNLVIDFDQWER